MFCWDFQSIEGYWFASGRQNVDDILAEVWQVRDLIALGFGSLVLLWCLTLIIVASARGRDVFKCPRCHSRRIRSSLHRPGDKILSLMEIKVYSCEACKKSFYALSRKQVVSSVH
jgi:hypothetical protein